MNQESNLNVTRQVDAEIFRSRNALNVTNANMFISNNNNPFLVSPYAPPTNVAKTSQINDINITISTLIGGLSSVINLSTFTLRICTITNMPGQNTVSISSQNVAITGDYFDVSSDTTFNNIVSFEDNTYFNNISTGFIFASNMIGSTILVNTLQSNTTSTNNISTGNLFASNANMSTLNVSSFNVNSITSLQISTNNISTGNLYSNAISTMNITFQTLNGSIINASTISVSSLISVSTISTTNINFISMNGTSITSDNLIVTQNISVSSINAASSISTRELIFSSLCMIPSTISSGVTTPLNSSILICLNGGYWKIPIEPV
jgi:hypothetical protein